MRLFLSAVALTSVCFLLAPFAQAEDSQQEDFKAALDFCLDPPANTDLARQNLQAIEFGEVDDDKATLGLALAAALASRFDLDDLEYSFSNAAFMSASWLGNSALGKDQPTFRKGQLELAAIGLNEDKPSCIIVGPPEAMLHSLGGARSQFYWRMNGQRIGYGFEQDHIFIFALFDSEKLMTTALDIEDRSMREYVQSIVVSHLPEAVLYVIPTSTWERE